jgi:hypothetical protein
MPGERITSHRHPDPSSKVNDRRFVSDRPAEFSLHFNMPAEKLRLKLGMEMTLSLHAPVRFNEFVARGN